MLIPGDDQHALVPVRRIADRFVDCFDQRLAQRHAVGGMLRVVHERKSQILGDRVVSGLDERIGGVVGGVVDVAGEVREIFDVVVETDPGEQADLREAVPGIDAERNLRPPQRIEDRPMLEGDAGAGVARRLWRRISPHSRCSSANRPIPPTSRRGRTSGSARSARPLH